MLGTRVLSGFCLITVLLGVLLLDEWFAPWFPFWFLLSILALGAAAMELAGLLGAAGTPPSLNTVLGGVAALIVANWLPHVTDALTGSGQVAPVRYEPVEPISVLSWPLLTFAGVLMVSFVIQSVQFVTPGRTMGRIAGTTLAIAYVGLLGSFIVQMRWLDGPYHGVMPLVFLIATAKGADTGAYTLGRLAGRHKLWPRLSPNKTIEGAIGGMVFAVAASLMVAAVSRYVLGIPTLDGARTVAFGLLVGVLAQLGDLMESMIKRDCQRKDASSAVPGYGGVLDVLDSLLFSGPVAYGFWVTFGP
jgi:phosphatidate cytidylyltransferase